MLNAAEMSRPYNLTRRYNELRGALLFPAAMALLALGAKLLWASFDSAYATNPSLFDRSGDFIWDIVSLLTLIAVPLIYFITQSYHQRIGIVREKGADKPYKLATQVMLFFGLALSIALDYSQSLPFSSFGLALLLLWLGFYWQPSIRDQKGLGAIVFSLAGLQLVTLISAPLVFSQMYEGLEFMRKVVGASMFVSGFALAVMGIFLHLSLMKGFRHLRGVNNVN